MKRKVFFIKGMAIFAVGVLIPVALAAEGAPEPRHLIKFSLLVNGGNPTPISFTLEPKSTDPRGLGVLSGSDLIEDPLGNTAIGYQAFYSNVSGQYNMASGFSALHYNTSGFGNTATGAFTLERNIDGTGNTATGAFALTYNTSGQGNTANGIEALMSNTSGIWNTATGRCSLWSNTTGEGNTANGYATLYFNTGSYNTASGQAALYSNTTGSYNTASGYYSLENNTGICNTAIGAQAGAACTDGNWNIYLGAFVRGAAVETNTIRIGLPYGGPSGQNQTFIAGVVENPMGSSADVVGIASDGRLGTIPFSSLPPGPPGPQGEGLVSESLLFLAAGVTPPSGYTLLGTCDFSLAVAGSKKPIKLTVNVYQKQ